MKKLALLFVLISSLCILTTSSHATIVAPINPFSSVDPFGLSPLWDWRTIETDHFRVIFPEELKTIAQRSANYLEEAHRILSPLFRWEPGYKPQVVVVDNADLANGLTAPVFRIGIVLWVTPPENWFSTSYYDDWLRFLILHECVHFYNMDTRSGFWKPLWYLFGDTILPNSVWNYWMLEGLAVYLETRFTTAGRGRSTYYEMVLRTAVHEGVLNTKQFVTLDQIGGQAPYYPKGDARYQFGYHLMNQVVKKDPLHRGEDVLGIMSERSSARIPFFINGNLENLTGKNWYDYWDEWTSETQIRLTDEIKKLQAHPVTEFHLLTQKDHEISNDALGMAFSPDRKWMAYSLGSADKRQGLYLRDMKTGETRHLDDKMNGIGMRFTPDSKALIYSEVRKRDQYSTFSDLRVYRLGHNSSEELTHRLRAKDPDVSRDGSWLTFTIMEHGSSVLAIAPLVQEEDRYQLGPVQRLFSPELYDHLANPQFSSDGNKIYFSRHPNGKSQEDLLEYDRLSKKITTLVSNGMYNRFPAVSPQGDLYFVSNLTGVDNLYQFNGDHPPTLRTNFITGLRFPTFGPEPEKPQLYASVFSSSGWDLAEIVLTDSPLSAKPLTLQAPPAPPMGSHSSFEGKFLEYQDQPYSVFSTLWPRAWTPLVGFGPQGFAFGVQLFGYDAVNRHRYSLGVSYETLIQQADAYAIYSNRSFGPSIDLSVEALTSSVQELSGGLQYSRQLGVSASISYPFTWTYSSLTPALGLNVQRSFEYLTGADYSQSALSIISPTIPSLDAVISFSNAETSGLAIAPEGGRYTALGTRFYMGSDEATWKGLFIDEEYIRLAKHTTLTPSVRMQWVSQLSASFPAADAVLAGRAPQKLFGPFRGNNLSQLSVRGYPQRFYLAKAAGTAALDLKVPIARIFSGWGTQPVFLENLYGFGFIEASAVSLISTVDYLLPSAGAGLRLSTELFFVPVTFSGEYHRGFRTELGGVNDLFFQIIVSALNF